MGVLGAAGVGAVALITTRLGARKSTAVPAGADGDAVSNSVVTLIRRDEWGAREPAVSSGGRGENGPYHAVTNPNGWMVYDEPLDEVLRMVVLHHSALPLTDGPVEIQRLHMDERGFADVGYHFLIDEAGSLYEGRPLNVRGAHAHSFNSGSVGVCLLGNFENNPPSQAQIMVLDALLTTLIDYYPSITRLAGHKDCNPGVTLCPGAHFYPLLDSIAQRHGLLYGI